MTSEETCPIIHNVDDTDEIDSSDNNTLSSRCSRFIDYILSVRFRLGLVIGTWGFLTGVERAIVLPTLWLYFFTKFSPEVATQYYGLTLGAFNVAVLIFSPIFGMLSYNGVRVKFLLLLSNQFEIVGNIVYFVASTPWLILLGRFIAGIGAGSEVPLYADVVRVTTKEERTGYIVALLMGRQFGLIIGPAITLVMHSLKFNMGQVQLNVYNSPGLFMAACWALHTCLTLIVYVNVNDDGKSSKSHMFTKRRAKSFNEKLPMADYAAVSHSVRDEEPKFPDELKAPPPITLISSDDSNMKPKSERASRKGCCDMDLSLYYTPVILVLMFFCFGAYYSLMALESVLSPVAKTHFGWDEVQVSYVYLSCGIAVIFVYGGLRWLSCHIEDRKLLLFGVGVLLFAYAMQSMAFVFFGVDKHRMTLMVLLLTGIALHVIGQPFCIACPESIFTKFIPIQDMDRAQTILRTIMNVAFVLGPIVGGTLIDFPYVVFLSMFLFILIPTFYLVSRFSLFRTNSDDVKVDNAMESNTKE